MRRIFVVGALVYDIVFDLPDWVEPNRAVHAREVTISPGGKALNQAVAARKLGADDVRLVGCVGADLFGAEMLAALRQAGVNADGVKTHPSARTSIASIIVKDQLPAFIGAPDASRRVDRDQIEAALADLRADDILLVNFELPQPLVRVALELGRDKGAVTALNPAPFFTRDSFVIEYLGLVDTLMPNLLEAQLLLGSQSQDSDELARGLLALGVGQVVLTLGESGSLYYDGACKIAQPAFLVDAVDTTGASDAFVGAYCLGLARGWAVERRLQFASAAAGLACAERGAMAALPSSEQVEALLQARVTRSDILGLGK